VEELCHDVDNNEDLKEVTDDMDPEGQMPLGYMTKMCQVRKICTETHTTKPGTYARKLDNHIPQTTPHIPQTTPHINNNNNKTVNI
jgi:hypothetical protein